MTDSRKVAILLYEGCTLLDFVGATQVFTQWAAGWSPVWVAKSAGPVSTSEGFDVVATHAFQDVVDADVIFVPGGSGAGVSGAMACGATVGWLAAQAARPGVWVGAVCVGTFVLGAADVLRGSKVTTHWLLDDVLRSWQAEKGFSVVEDYPRSVIDDQTLRFTGGGVSASIDLALALVARLSSLDKANYASLIIQYEPELPPGVLPGSPTTTAPATKTAVRTNPAIQTNFIAPIKAAVEGA